MPMIDDFTPIIHHLDGRTIRLWAVADVHLGARECDQRGFEKFLDKIASDDDSYMIIDGDLLNNATRSSVSNIFEETMPPSAQIDVATELLNPVADKILCVVGGNHEARSRKDTDLDPLYAVCSMVRRSDGSCLQDIYRQNMAFIRIVLGDSSPKDNYAIMVTHGKGINKRKQFQAIVEGVDACIFAHTHTPDVLRPARIRFTSSNRVKTHNIVSLTCSSFLEPGGYSLQNLYTPQATSLPQCLELEFTGTNRRDGQIRVIW